MRRLFQFAQFLRRLAGRLRMGAARRIEANLLLPTADMAAKLHRTPGGRQTGRNSWSGVSLSWAGA